MSWPEIAALAIVALIVGVTFLVAVPLALLIRTHNRATRRRELLRYRRGAGISLPGEYEGRRWVDLSR